MTHIKKVVCRPVSAQAMQNDGLIDTGDMMVRWVQRRSPKQSLVYEGSGTARMILSVPGETYDLYEGWWLVLENDRFVVLDPGEFAAKYEIKE